MATNTVKALRDRKPKTTWKKRTTKIVHQWGAMFVQWCIAIEHGRTASKGRDMISVRSLYVNYEERMLINRLDAIWHLLGISGWTIELLEKILKETVLFSSESFLLDGLEFAKESGQGANTGRRPNSAAGDPFGSPAIG